jgi:hypothetical protein
MTNPKGLKQATLMPWDLATAVNPFAKVLFIKYFEYWMD